MKLGEIIISKNILKEDKDVFITSGIVRAEFNFWVGLVMDGFFESLKNKKFIGTKCSKCGRVMVPPRNRCGICFANSEDFVDLPEIGTLKNFTVTNYIITERKIRTRKDGVIVGLVQLDGADTAMIVPIINVNVENIREGMKVKVVWANNLKGRPQDIQGFEPFGGV